MHPRYKTRYFKKECWLDEWVDEAVSLAREIWITHYRDSMPPSLSTSAASANTSTSTGAKVCHHTSPSHHLLYPWHLSSSINPSFFSFYHHLLCSPFHIASLSLSSEIVEIIVLRILLLINCIRMLTLTSRNPWLHSLMTTTPKIHWIHLKNIFEHRASRAATQWSTGINSYYRVTAAWQLTRSTTYQRPVSNIVFIFLWGANIYIATSVDCERAFSASGNIISKLRNSFKDDSARAACILNNWCRRENLLADNEFQQQLQKGWAWGSKRSKGVGSSGDSGNPIEI